MKGSTSIVDPFCLFKVKGESSSLSDTRGPLNYNSSNRPIGLQYAPCTCTIVDSIRNHSLYGTPCYNMHIMHLPLSMSLNRK